METKLKGGTTLILDRYSYSGVAFSCAKGLDLEWCKVKIQINNLDESFVYLYDINVSFLFVFLMWDAKTLKLCNGSFHPFCNLTCITHFFFVVSKSKAFFVIMA